MSKETFFYEIEHAINKYSKENNSNTPDFILADFLCGCLKLLDEAISKREKWYGRKRENDDPIIVDRKTHEYPKELK